eukprot:756811-Hanusia_phi.AAC.11
MHAAAPLRLILLTLLHAQTEAFLPGTPAPSSRLSLFSPSSGSFSSLRPRWLQPTAAKLPHRCFMPLGGRQNGNAGDVHCMLSMTTDSEQASVIEDSYFSTVGLIPELCAALHDINIITPTPIQKESLPLSLAGESVLLCAETGSGKSLAFLLPLVNRLKVDEFVLGINARPKRPRAGELKRRLSLLTALHAVVIVPTRELGSQILGVAKGLSKHAKHNGSAGMEIIQRAACMTVLQGFGEELKKIFEAISGASAAAREVSSLDCTRGPSDGLLQNYVRSEELRAKLEAKLAKESSPAVSYAR